jgi:hypothetical protein
VVAEEVVAEEAEAEAVVVVVVVQFCHQLS